MLDHHPTGLSGSGKSSLAFDPRSSRRTQDVRYALPRRGMAKTAL
jgi:excinuclease UvrABC ATPase subunit